MQDSSGTPRLVGPPFWLLGMLGSIWLVGSLLVVLPKQSALRSQARYQAVTAEVVSVEKRRGALDRLSHSCSTADGRGPRQIYVTYRYEVAGKPYTGTKFDARYAGELFCSEETATARLNTLERDKVVTAHYDPAAPGQVVLQLEDPSEVTFLLLVFGVLGAGLVGLTMRQLWRRRAIRRATEELT